MQRLNFIFANAWNSESIAILADSRLWLGYVDEVDKEVCCRLCSLADTAAGTFCGLFPIEWPYMAIFEFRALPWLSDWEVQHEASTEDRPIVTYQANHKERFFSDVERVLKRLDEDLIKNGYAFDPLDVLYNNGSDVSKEELIKSICVVMLCHINEAINHLERSRHRELSISMSSAYQCLSHLQIQCSSYVDGRVRGGVERHLRDPKAKDKAFVYECWQDWQSNPSAYRGPTAFAKDMLDKVSNLSSDTQVIMRWAREWKNGKAGP